MLKKILKKISFLSEREKYVLYIAVIIIFTGVIFNFFVAPVFNKRRNLSEKIEFKKMELKKKYRLLSKAEQLKNWDNYFPFDLNTEDIKQDKVTKILKYVETVSKKSDVQIINISPEGLKEYDDYKFIFVNLVLKGKMGNIVKFLYDIESSSMLFTVESFQIEVDRGSSNHGNMKVFLEISKLII